VNSRSTCGFVVRIAEHGESDKLVTLYSADLGRVTGIAKGARNSKKRFVNKLEEFSFLRLHYRPPRGPAGLYFIAEAELLCAHLPLRMDYRKFAAAAHLCELLLRFARDNDPDPHAYALLNWALPSLCSAKTPQKVLVLSHLHLLSILGYRPALDQCGACRQPVGPGRTYVLAPGAGSLVCSACNPVTARSLPRLSVQTLRLLANAQTTSLDRLNRLQLSRQSVDEAMAALHYYTLHLLQQDIHSWSTTRRLLGGFS
jgi:DNA repair protein RecO (recombination protein O)